MTKSKKSKKSKRTPRGTILRRAYTRKSYVKRSRSGSKIRIKATSVKAGLIKDRGAPGKGAKVIPELKKGILSKRGYKFNASRVIRNKAIEEAIKKGEPALGVFRHLVARSTLLKRTQPVASKVMKADALALQKRHKIGSKKAKKSKKTKRSRKH